MVQKRAFWIVRTAVFAIVFLAGAASGCEQEYYDAFGSYGAYSGYGYGGYYDGYDYVAQGLGYSNFDDWAGSSISTFAGDFVSYD